MLTSVSEDAGADPHHAPGPATTAAPVRRGFVNYSYILIFYSLQSTVYYRKTKSSGGARARYRLEFCGLAAAGFFFLCYVTLIVMRYESENSMWILFHSVGIKNAHRYSGAHFLDGPLN